MYLFCRSYTEDSNVIALQDGDVVHLQRCVCANTDFLVEGDRLLNYEDPAISTLPIRVG